MALRDVLFGRKKLSEPKDDRLFALTTAAVTLQTELGLVTAGSAAVAFKPQSSGEFRSAFDDVDKLIEAVAPSSEAIYAAIARRYGARKLGELQDMLHDLEHDLSGLRVE